MNNLYKIPNTNDPVSIILKLAGETCNINCIYCYEKRKPYKDSKVITIEELTMLKKLCKNRPVKFELHGGEPLVIGKKHMEKILSFLKLNFNTIGIAIQTNGLKLSREWITLLQKYFPKISIGISFDGTQSANFFRRTYGDKETYVTLMEKLDLLDELGVNYGIISTVTALSLGQEEEILADVGKHRRMKFLKFSPCFDYDSNNRNLLGTKNDSFINMNSDEKGIPKWGISPAEYSMFLKKVYDIWKEKNLFNQFNIEPIQSVIRTLMGKMSTFCHFSQYKCSHVLTLYPTGTIGGCDEFLKGTGTIGKVSDFTDLDECIEVYKQKMVDKKLMKLLDKCKTCRIKDYCKGGCLNTRLKYYETPLYEAYCEHRMEVIDFVNDDLIREQYEKV